MTEVLAGRLEKSAGVLSAPLRFAGSLVGKIPEGWRNVAGAAATTGAAGSLVGGAQGYAAAKQRGEGGLDAAKSGLVGAAKGGAIGGAIGGGLGAGSKLWRGNAAPVMSGAEAQGMHKTLDKSISDFGQRQVHALTGYVPEAARGSEAGRAAHLRNIGYGGRLDPREYVRMAEENLANVGSTPSILPDFARKAYHKYDKFTSEQAAKSFEALNRAQATSVPGYARALFDSKRRPDVLRAAKHEVLSGGALGAMGAIGAAQGVYSAATGQRGPVDDPNAPVDRAGNLGAAVGNLAGMALPGFTVPIGFALQPAIGHTGMRIGSAIGRAVGSATGKIPAMMGGQSVRHDPTDPVASGTPYYESTTSSSAAGKPYGGGISQ